jgi:hypothetical protein
LQPRINKESCQSGRSGRSRKPMYSQGYPGFESLTFRNKKETKAKVSFFYYKIMEINPLYYGLPSRVQLKELANNHIGIYKVIKSRIIQKDAAKIVATANQLKSVAPKLEVTLICTRNICSKSIALLDKEGIDVQFVD